MALDMRALYYIALARLLSGEHPEQYEKMRAIENCLNQNFAIISHKLAEIDARLSFLEGVLDSL